MRIEWKRRGDSGAALTSESENILNCMWVEHLKYSAIEEMN